MKYKHALFLNPYIESAATSIMGLFPPTGLEYVATSARGFADKVTILDLRQEKYFCDTANLIDFIRSEVDIVCVSIGWRRQFKEVCDLLNLMPDDIPLVVGGYTATEETENMFSLCPKVDIIVRGEGEETIREILKGEPLEDIRGISYRANGGIIHNANRPLPSADSVPTPDRTLRRAKYNIVLNGTKVTDLSFDSVLSARGCPNKCKFCTFSLNPLGQKRGYSARNIDSVIKEIEGISADVVLFSDDNFFADPKRAEAICDLIVARGIKKRFIAQARIEIAKHPQLLDKAVKAGFKLLLMGIESPHDRILKQLNKGFDSDTVRKAFRTLKKYPIYYHGYFIYGNIGETKEEMLDIPKFAKEIGVDSITFQKLRIEKFSQLKEIAEKTPGYYVTENGELYSDAYSHKALKKIGRHIKFSFYTPLQLVKIFLRARKIKLFTLKERIDFLGILPVLVKNVIIRDIQKARLGDSLKRIFIRNKA